MWQNNSRKHPQARRQTTHVGADIASSDPLPQTQYTISTHTAPLMRPPVPLPPTYLIHSVGVDARVSEEESGRVGLAIVSRPVQRRGAHL